MAKAATKATDVAVLEDKVTDVAAFDYGEDAGAGTEGMTSADVSIPFINLLQPLSPEVEEGGSAQVEGARPGMFYNSVTKELTDGKKGFLFQPCARQHVYVEWIPRDSGGGFVGVHLDNAPEVIQAIRQNGGSSNQLKLGDNDLIETVYLYGHILDEDGVTSKGFAVFAATSTKLKPLKDAMTIVVTARVGPPEKRIQPPLYAYRFKFTSFGDKNKKGQPFFNIKVDPKALPLLSRVDSAENALYLAGKDFKASVDSGAKKADIAAAADKVRQPGEEDVDTPF